VQDSSDVTVLLLLVKVKFLKTHVYMVV